MPITDYITDTISVLDQSIRVLQAYIDITAEQGCLSTTLMLIQTMVSIKQALWDDADPLTLLPGLVHGRQFRQVTTLGLQDLSKLSRRAQTDLSRKLGVRHENLDKFIRVANAMPSLAITTDQKSVATININLQREGQSYGPEFRAYTPFFPKSQSEGWFVFLCDVENDEILALKRASFTQYARTVTKLGIPEECKDLEVQLLVVSDVYPGVHYRQTVKLQGEEVPVARAEPGAQPVVMSVDSGASKSSPRSTDQQQLE